MIRRLLTPHATFALAVAVLALGATAFAQNRGRNVVNDALRFGRDVMYGNQYAPNWGGYPGGYRPGTAYGGNWSGNRFGMYQPGFGYNYPGTYGGSTAYYQNPGVWSGQTGYYTYPQQYAVPQTGVVQQYGVPQTGTFQQYGVPQTGTVPQYGVPQYGVPQSGAVQQYAMPQTGYAQPGMMAPAGGATQSLYQPSGGGGAKMTVKLPAEAKLWVDDYQSRQTGAERVLWTPPLTPGQKFQYTLKAQWDDKGQPVTQERTAEVQSGADVTIDFNQPAGHHEPLGTPQDKPQPPAGTPPATNPPADTPPANPPSNPPPANPATPPPPN